MLPGRKWEARFAPMVAMRRAGGVLQRCGQAVLRSEAIVRTNARWKVYLYIRASI